MQCCHFRRDPCKGLLDGKDSLKCMKVQQILQTDRLDFVNTCLATQTPFMRFQARPERSDRNSGEEDGDMAVTSYRVQVCICGGTPR